MPSEAATTLKGQPLDKTTLDAMLRRRMFFTPAFEIYQPVGGLYDYGPPGTALQTNIVDLWRKHFVLEENMLEVDCTVLTPYEVLKTSGHVDKFADWMCKDPKTGDLFRADHFVEEMLELRLKGDREARGISAAADDDGAEEDAKKKKRKAKLKMDAVQLDDSTVKEYSEVLARIDNYDGDGLGELIKKYELKNPASGVLPDPPAAFNLMFQTSIGPSSSQAAFLRPETAQGQFCNYGRLLEYNQGQMPFASASVGKSYRNEISPRGGLLRVREFLMAEIEHFVDPESGKAHDRFPEVEAISLSLLDGPTQLAGRTETRRITIGDAVRQGVVNNETLGYFMARIYLFMEKIGVDVSKMRFRQHMANEMAHYACDCWDCELLTSSGWIECVGCADRSAYDLQMHMKATGAPLTVRQRLDSPVIKEEWDVDIDRKKLGPKFRADAKRIEEALLATSQPERQAFAKDLAENGTLTVAAQGKEFTLGKDLVAMELRKKTEHTREYIPNVIEPSFGIGRILYSVIEHCYWTRASDGGDEARSVLSFPPSTAPTKVLLVPLSNNEQFSPFVGKISARLRALGIAYRTDATSATIGKRYSRNDELGTPFGITIDFQTVQDGTVTLRERDSMLQVRDSEDTILQAVSDLVSGAKSWPQIKGELAEFVSQEVEVTINAGPDAGSK